MKWLKEIMKKKCVICGKKSNKRKMGRDRLVKEVIYDGIPRNISVINYYHPECLENKKEREENERN